MNGQREVATRFVVEVVLLQGLPATKHFFQDLAGRDPTVRGGVHQLRGVAEHEVLHVFVLDLMIVNRGNFGEGGGQRTNQHQRLNHKHAQVQLCLTLSSSNFVVGRGCITNAGRGKLKP